MVLCYGSLSRLTQIELHNFLFFLSCITNEKEREAGREEWITNYSKLGIFYFFFAFPYKLKLPKHGTEGRTSVTVSEGRWVSSSSKCWAGGVYQGGAPGRIKGFWRRDLSSDKTSRALGSSSYWTPWGFLFACFSSGITPSPFSKQFRYDWALLPGTAPQRWSQRPRLLSDILGTRCSPSVAMAEMGSV